MRYRIRRIAALTASLAMLGAAMLAVSAPAQATDQPLALTQVSNPYVIPAHGSGDLFARCPSGSQPVSGGIRATQSNASEVAADLVRRYEEYTGAFYTMGVEN